MEGKLQKGTIRFYDKNCSKISGTMRKTHEKINNPRGMWAHGREAPAI